ncbi:MAG: acyl carrier protein [Lentisphaeraceae bacterium]|nr:acyl carrier protein [Lentisphaeraceae bacterium]
MKDLSKDEIFTKVQAILVETFELSEDEVTPKANLYTDLDLDSIDAVDLVITLQEMTDKKVDPESFKQIRTVQDVVDSVYELVQGE